MPGFGQDLYVDRLKVLVGSCADALAKIIDMSNRGCFRGRPEFASEVPEIDPIGEFILAFSLEVLSDVGFDRFD